MAEQRAKCEPHEAPAAGALCDAHAQHALVERVACADAQAVHPVGVVADEDERRAVTLLALVGAQPGVEKRVAAQRGERRPGEGRPLAAPEPRLLQLALMDDLRVQAEARVVEKEAAVDIGDIDRMDVAVGDRCERGFGFERDAEVAGEMVQRAQRQHAECDSAAHQRTGDAAERAVAAARDDDAAIGGERAAHGRIDLRAAVERFDRPAVGEPRHRLVQPGEPLGAEAGAGVAVDDEGGARRRHDRPCEARCRDKGSTQGPGGGALRQIASQAQPSTAAASTSLR